MSEANFCQGVDLGLDMQVLGKRLSAMFDELNEVFAA